MAVNLSEPMTPLDVLRTLHRGDGAIAGAFDKKEIDGKKVFRSLGSFTVEQWPEHFAELEPYCENLYFTINSTSAKAQRFVGKSKLTGLQSYSRKGLFLSYLNAVYVDLDIGHDDKFFNFQNALQSFLSDAAQRGIPEPSMVSSSGCGVWGIWLLRDRRDQTPVAAFPGLQAYAQKINQLAAKTFKADLRCTDTARVMRWPGSINPAALPENQVVRFYLLSDTEYTLDELGAAFGLTPQKTSFDTEYTPVSSGKSERHIKAGVARWTVPLEGFLQLRKMRGGFSAGTRTLATYYYAMLLRKARRDPRVITDECMKLAAECNPPLDEAIARKAIASSRDSFRHVRHDTLARDLKITPEERAALPQWFKPPRKSKLQVAQQVAQRRAAIDKIVKAEGREVSLREMAQLLAERHGITVTHITVRSDYKVLGIKSAPSTSNTCLTLSVAVPALPSISNTDLTPTGKLKRKRAHAVLSQADELLEFARRLFTPSPFPAMAAMVPQPRRMAVAAW